MRSAFAKPNRLWQRQLKISSAFVSLELGPAEGTGRQPSQRLFSPLTAAAEGPLQGLSRCNVQSPGPWSPSHGARAERAPSLPDRRSGSCCSDVRCLAPARALQTRPRLRAGDLGAEPGTAAPDGACLRWAVCFWDFSKADGVRGPLSRGTVIPLEAGL